MAAEALVERRLWREILGGQALAIGSAFLFAGLTGAVIILLYGESPLAVYRTIWVFSTERPADVARVLTNATPLIFSGLAVAVAFKAGMFNIGVEGQYIVGMLAATLAALGLDFMPAPLHLTAVVLAAMAGSMLWALLPAILKVKTGAHEVVTTIMMNGMAGSLLTWFLLHPLRSQDFGQVDLRSNRFPESALVPDLGSSLGIPREVVPSSAHLSWLFPIAIVACVLVWYVLYRTRLGYEARALGSSTGSAEAGGVSIGATQIKVFLLSGALAGLTGLNHLLADKGFLGQNYETQLGFTGIAVAFLGRNHPLGIPLAALLFGVLARGEQGIQIETDVPREIIIILQGLLILSVVIAHELVRRRLARRRQRAGGLEEPTEEAPA